jgi:hypothetical protein
MNFFGRVTGTFFNPGDTFKALAEKPVWLDVILIVLLGVLLFSTVSTPYLQQDQIQILEDNTRLRDRYGDEQFEQMLELRKNPPPWQTYMGYSMAGLGLLAGLLISSLVILFLGRMGSTEGRFGQIFAALVHASLIDKILGNGVRAFLVLSKKSFFQSMTSPAMFFPQLEPTSFTYTLLNQFDFFQLWMFGILALGLTHIFKVELKRALFISYFFWFLKGLLNLGISILVTQLYL